MKIDWKKEAEFINTYSDYTIKLTKEGVVDYVEFISSINSYEELFSNEKRLYKYIIKHILKNKEVV